MSGLMGMKEAAAPPPPPPPTPMADEEAIKRAKERALKRSAGRTGRESTILSEKTETLGAGR